MKPGDLVRLDTGFGEKTYIVEVPKSSNSGQFSRPNGALAIFLGPHALAHENTNAELKSLILVDGRVGWVYESELEEIDDEAR